MEPTGSEKNLIRGPEVGEQKGFSPDEMLRWPLSHRGGETNCNDSFRGLRRDVNHKLKPDIPMQMDGGNRSGWRICVLFALVIFSQFDWL